MEGVFIYHAQLLNIIIAKPTGKEIKILSTLKS